MSNHDCTDTRSTKHFEQWYAQYKMDIDELWRQFNVSMEEYIEEPVRYTFNDFVDFVYWKSSGTLIK